MPGFTIHMAIGEEYIRINKNKIKDEKEFLKGTIAPDLNEDMTEITKEKSKTHYGKWGKYEVETNIKDFLEDENVDINKDYYKGYLLHLISDHYFYNKVFKEEHQKMKLNNDRFYDDYDCLNYDLINKYNVKILDNIKKYMITKKNNNEPKYLKIDKVEDFIDEMSNIDLEKIIKIIEEKGMGGLK